MTSNSIRITNETPQCHTSCIYTGDNQGYCGKFAAMKQHLCNVVDRSFNL